jgi:hypothetical protein
MAHDFETETRIADDHAQQRRQNDAERDAEPRRHIEIVPQQRRHVGADAHEGAMAERDQPEPPHRRPGGIDEPPQQDLDQQVEKISGRDQRQRDQHAQAGDRPYASRLHRRTIPCGRTNMSTMNSMNAST